MSRRRGIFETVSLFDLVLKEPIRDCSNFFGLREMIRITDNFITPTVYEEDGKYHVIDGALRVLALRSLGRDELLVFIVAKPNRVLNRCMEMVR